MLEQILTDGKRPGAAKGMRKLASLRWVLLLIGFSACAVSSSTQVQKDSSLIVSGKSVGPLSLGASRADVEAAFPFKKNMDQETTFSDCESITEINWVSISGKRTEAGNVFVYLRDGKVFQIESALPRFHTAEGIQTLSAPDLVRKHFTNLEAYALHPSGGQMFDFHDFVYWVSRDQGIAFELGYYRQARLRLVSKVIVFEPNTEFIPEGCISRPQQWKKLPPYSIEDPCNASC